MSLKEIIQNLSLAKRERLDFLSQHGYKNFFNVYIGVDNEELYNWEIYKLQNKIESTSNIMIFTNFIHISTDFGLIERLKRDLERVNMNDFSSSNLKLVASVQLNEKINKGLDSFVQRIGREIQNDRVKLNFIIKFLSWITDYANQIDITDDIVPKCIFYGNIKKHEVYFLIFLNSIGFDVLYLNPTGRSNIEILKEQEITNLQIDEYELTQEISYQERVALGEKADKNMVSKIVTVAARATKQVERELLSETGMVINSWQLQDKKIVPNLLSSTVEEISIYFKEPLSMRPGYKLDNSTIEAPVFLTTILGVNEDEDTYHEFVNGLRNSEQCLFVHFDGKIESLTKEFSKEDFSLSFAIKRDKTIDKTALIDNKKHTLSTVSKELQNLLIDKIEGLINSNLIVGGLSSKEETRCLHAAINITEEILFLVEGFDYGKVNPKIVIYINSRISISKEFAFIILLLNKLCFDVIILSTTGFLDIEKFIDTRILDIHKLDKNMQQFELKQILESNLQEKSIFKKIFGKRR